MINKIHTLQFVFMIAILATSFFISYGFFITNISFRGELFLVSTTIVAVLALSKFLLKMQFYTFIKRNNARIEINSPLNKEGKKRILSYDILVWGFMLILALFQTKLFGISDELVMSYYFALGLDILFWIIFQNKFQAALISGQIMIFSSRPQTVSLKNIKTIENRYNDFYINYTTGKFSLLKSDLLSEKMIERVNASF